MSQTKLVVPDSLQQQLASYQRRVWSIKIAESLAIAAVGCLVAFLVVYAVDRWMGMPWIGRWVAWGSAVAAIAFVPLFFVRWVMRYRTLEPTTRLLGNKLPVVGDQLLGVIELSKNTSEQNRSMSLCQAAMRQVAEDASKRDFNVALPSSHHVGWSVVAAGFSIAAFSLAVMFPAASGNALSRLAMPWLATPRFTFTKMQPLPDEVIVAHGEVFPISIALADDSDWQPETASLQIGEQPPLVASLAGGGYEFSIPPQIASLPMTLSVGDVVQTVEVSPTLRPELSSVLADVTLPDYLGHAPVQAVDTRSGRLSIVKGSRATITAVANRDLASASVNDDPRDVKGSQLTSPPFEVDATPQIAMAWKDRNGLAGREPFTVSITAVDDEAPTLICDGLPRQAVVLETETLSFKVRASDDFGVRRVGMMWRGLDARGAGDPAKGERPLGAGDPHADPLELVGTFTASSLGIEPQPIELFVWAEDYLPGRKRVFSPPHILYVLTPDQHAIWMTEQLAKWHRQAMEVRDRERQLHEKNKTLRELPVEELAKEENRREVQRQATAERANGQRLHRLGDLGRDLVRTASKNPEIGVGHLERWAEMLRVLDDLANERMPSVADLLAKTSQIGTATPAGKVAPTLPSDAPPKKFRDAPTIALGESSMNSPDETEVQPGPPKKPSGPALRLPVTTVMGKAPKPSDAKPPEPTPESPLETAVQEQADLLAEFDKLSDELNAVLANLEGSTLVKRLKAASRQQETIAGTLTSNMTATFGTPKKPVVAPVVDRLKALQETEVASTTNVSYIMDDLAAYFERRRFAQFKTVLDEMKEADVLGSLRRLAERIPSKQGWSVAQAEFWADSMDRWAETLVDPACSGQCPGGKSPESLPPSIVLEVLQILEAEIGLREETRVAEQAKTAVAPEQHVATSKQLSETQAGLSERVMGVLSRIAELENAAKHFEKEIEMLYNVDRVMTEAVIILETPDTGSRAIAAETEAIELLLRSKRINPKGGGAGGASPGGGGTGTTTDSALALMGQGRNAKEVREDRKILQTTGQTGPTLPEEFRSGLDQYFNRLGGS